MSPLHEAWPVRLISWNLLHRDGVERTEIAALIAQERPDVLVMQEVTEEVAGIVALVGGAFEWEPLPGRRHGLATWTRHDEPNLSHILSLPRGSVVRRVCQIVDVGPFTIANVHLSHGQLLNRRQLRYIGQRLPQRAAVIGDFNMVGPSMLPGFHDVGPRRPTHRMSRLVPLRLDRCLVRGLACSEAQMLSRGASDHHPIMMHLWPSTAAPSYK